jgi:hypothetical protein
VRKAALLWLGIGSVASCGERAGGCLDVGKPVELMARALYSDSKRWQSAL